MRSARNATAPADAQDRAESLYRYDPLDRIVRITDPKGLHTDYRYNGFGDLLEQRSPDSGTTTFGHDPAGNVIAQTDANGKVTAYRFDALNRLRMVDYAAAVPDETFGWDIALGDCPAGEQFAAGRLGRIVDGSGSTSYCWNRFGDLTRMVQRTGGRTFTVRWVYQADGRLQRLIYPGGIEVDYRYDAQGRIAEIGVNSGSGRQVLLTGATYHPFGEVSGWTYGNGLALRRTIDADGLPVAVEDGPLNGDSVGLALGYGFDAAGNLTRLRSGRTGAPGTRTQTYEYDGQNRLTAVLDGELLLDEYRYDRSGNRTQVGEWMQVGNDGGSPGNLGPPLYDFVTRTYAYPADSHRLQQIGGDLREHDPAGNLTQWGDPTAPGGPRGILAYNEGNRLASFSRLPGVIAASYDYNALGQRVRKRVDGGLDTFTVYTPDGRWLGDFNASGGAEQLAIWLGDLPVGLITGNGSQARLSYVQADALGTPRAVIDPQRNVAVWRWDALGEAFGRDDAQTDPDGDGVHFHLDMRFPGQRFDAETGFHYNDHRDYDPATGRYIQSDPIGLAGGMTTYGYANGSPGVYSDPEGLAVVAVGAGAVVRLSVRVIAPRLGIRSMLDPALRAAAKEAALKWQLKRQLKRQAARLARNGVGKPQACVTPGKYSVGPYNELRGAVPGLDAHHVGQKALMKRFIPSYDASTAPTILVPKVGHTIRGPSGIVSRSANGISNARGLVARDIRELRRVYSDIPNSRLQQLIRMNKEMYPSHFVK